MARRNNTQNPNQNQQPQQQPSRPSADAENARSRAASEYNRIQGEILETERKLAEARAIISRTADEQLEKDRKISQLVQERVVHLQQLQAQEQEISSILDDQENTEKNIVEIIRKRRRDQSEVKDLSQSVLVSMREQRHEMTEISDVGRQVTENMQASSDLSRKFGNILQTVTNQLAEI
jgi:chromosome segregation ATPase